MRLFHRNSTIRSVTIHWTAHYLICLAVLAGHLPSEDDLAGVVARIPPVTGHHLGKPIQGPSGNCGFLPEQHGLGIITCKAGKAMRSRRAMHR